MSPPTMASDRYEQVVVSTRIAFARTWRKSQTIKTPSGCSCIQAPRSDAHIEDLRVSLGAIIVLDSGQPEAFLHDEWQPWLPDHEGALQHLLALGAEEFIATVLH